MSIYSTDDFHLAAYLMTLGYSRYAGVERQNGTRRKAILLDPEPPAEAIENYYSGTASVSALAMSLNYNRLVTSSRNTP
jgi:hypothetical protein